MFFYEYGLYQSRFSPAEPAKGASTFPDFVLKVDGEEQLLVEAKSPSVMIQAGLPVPPMHIKLSLNNQPNLVRNIFINVSIISYWLEYYIDKVVQVAVHLAQRKLEWLFLTSHNHWVVYRLVHHGDHTFLAYSPKISIENSSVPFRAFLGASLSAIKKIPITPSVFNLHCLESFEEDQDPQASSTRKDDMNLDNNLGASSYESTIGRWQSGKLMVYSPIYS